MYEFSWIEKQILSIGESGTTLTVVTLSYLAAIKFGLIVMKDKPAYSLKTPLVIHNFLGM
jgi:hypothetical protein